MKRAILMIVDSLGIGAMKDAGKYRSEDSNSNTLKHVIDNAENIKLNNLERLGLMNVFEKEVDRFKYKNTAVWGKAALCYKGADSFFGHYEIMGSEFKNIVEYPFSHYVDKIYEELCNNGYEVEYFNKGNKLLLVNKHIIISDNIEADLGNVYSVIGSLKKVSFNTILEVGHIVRDIVKVSRVVNAGCNLSIEELIEAVECKDDFIGINAPKCNLYNNGYVVKHMGYFENKEGNLIDLLKKNNLDIVLIGKIADILDCEKAKNIDCIDTKYCMEKVLEAMNDMTSGLIAVNIQETDIAGHLQDVLSYGEQLKIVDEYLNIILKKMKNEDMLIITADHGNDPTIGHRMHTREYVPILVYDFNSNGRYIGIRETLGDVGASIAEHLNIGITSAGTSFV